MHSRRILITGVSSPLGGRVAQALEQQPGIDAVVGVDGQEPRHELRRTEFVRVDTDTGPLRRIIAAAAIDTVIDTRLMDDPMLLPLARVREINVTDTRRLLSACAAPDSPVRKLIFKSSAHVYGSEPRAPLFMTESMRRRTPPRTAIERHVSEAELAVAEFAAARPRTRVTVLRCADGIGGEIRSSYLSLLALPVVPSILGFDPRCQFIHLDDVVAALAHAAAHDLPGAYNVAADGVLALSEVVSLLGKPLLPILPPWGTVFAAAQLRRVGLQVPLELLAQLQAGRGLDNRRLKASGFTLRYTTREAVLKLRAQQRLRPLLGSGEDGYHYEREVEEFLRRSPSVKRVPAADAPAGQAHEAAPVTGSRAGQGHEDLVYASLGEGELIELIGSLAPEALVRLRRYEAAHGRRERVLTELDRRLTRLAPKRRG